MTQHEDPCGEDCYASTRREFGALALGAGLVAATGAGAEEEVMVAESDVTIKTTDGVCDAHLAQPISGPGAGVLVWPDIGGLRPVFRDMGARLARQGYTVLTVNPFYRVVKAPIAGEISQEDRAKYRGSVFADGAAERDAKAFVAYLDSLPMVDKARKIGVTGYCMGGPLTMRSAATVPDRIAAAASFHGGGLATDQPNSPHLLVPKIKARYVIAIADNDDQKDPAAKDKLRAAFAQANNPADIEVFKGADHGWCVPGSRAYNEPQAERAWGKLLTLFKNTLA